MEGHCSTGQSPHGAVVPMEEEVVVVVVVMVTMVTNFFPILTVSLPLLF